MGQKVMFVANDWHTAMVPVYVAGKFRPHGVYKDARCCLAIHNLSHQGVEQGRMFDDLGLPHEWWADAGLPPWLLRVVVARSSRDDGPDPSAVCVAI